MFHNVVTKLTPAIMFLSVFVLFHHPKAMCQTENPPGAIPDTSITGTWQGALKFNGNQLRLVFHITKTDSGTLTGSLDSPDQGAKGLPISNIILSQDSVKLIFTTISGEFAGKLSVDRISIEGQWTQGSASLPLSMSRTTVDITYNRPQEPKPPFPYTSEDVSFESKTTGMKYFGTLTVPDSGRPFPAAVLITGSGGHDRNEELMGHKPFLVIADYLTRRGIAVLRVDDRGWGNSTGNKMAVTSAEHAKDVIAEIEYLKSRNEINPDKIGLIGHSEGGAIAPMVAAQSNDVAFLVSLAGPGTTGAECIVDQTRLILKSYGAPDSAIDAATNELKNEYRILTISNDSTIVADSLRKYLRAAFPHWANDNEKKQGDVETAIDKKITSLFAPWFHYFLLYDPQPTLEKVKCPVLAMDGTLDLQVPAEKNLKAIGDALKKGGNNNYTIKLLPGLNHLFQDAKTGSPTEYAQIEETFSPEALKAVGDWIVEKTEKR